MTERPATTGVHASDGNAPDAPSDSGAQLNNSGTDAARSRRGNVDTSGRGANTRKIHAPVVMTGWVLYLVSWVTPSVDGKQFGASAFVQSARLAWHLLSMGNIVAGLCVTLGWLANFSILPRRLPIWLRVVAIAAPWLAFAVVLAKLPARATYFLYFYPWALGIALIHAARCSSMKAAS